MEKELTAEQIIWTAILITVVVLFLWSIITSWNDRY
jgi:hypothetical protein